MFRLILLLLELAFLVFYIAHFHQHKFLSYQNHANSSYIVENAEERKKFDSYFTEVYGKDVMDNDGNTEGLATGGINDGKYYHDYDVDPTRGIKETDLEYTSEKVGEGDSSAGTRIFGTLYCPFSSS